MDELIVGNYYILSRRARDCKIHNVIDSNVVRVVRKHDSGSVDVHYIEENRETFYGTTFSTRDSITSSDFTPITGNFISIE